MKKFITHVGLLALTIFATVFLGLSAVNAQSNAYDSAGLSAPTVTSDKNDYVPGEIAHITGSGWTLDQGVHVEFKESPDYPDYHIYDLTINADGTWKIDYTIEERHLGVKFTVVADGKASSYRATYIFTDAPSISSQPQSTTVTHGDNAIFTTTATPKNATPVTWQINTGSFQNPIWTNASSTNTGTFSVATDPTTNGITSSTLTISGVNYTLLNGKQFRAVFTQGQTTATNAATLTVNKKELTVTGITANGKPYDGNTTVTGFSGTATLSGKVGTDAVTLGGTPSGTFGSKDAGTQAVTVTGYTISGGDAGNYNFSQPSGLSATITAKALTVTGITANGKPYDGNTTVTGFSGTATLSGKVGTDAVTLGGTPSGTFASKAAGTQAVTVTGYTISGGDAGNYNFSQPSGLSATITAKALTVTGITANGKPYDGNTTVTGFSGTATLSGKVGTDAVTLGGTPSGTFASKDAGTQAVTVTGYTISGGDAGNYNFSQPSGLSATITAKALTVTGITANGKPYDGNTTVTGFSGTATLSGKVGTDAVTLGGTPSGTFGSKDAGTQAVTVTGYTISGGDAGNYNFSQPSGLSATITAKALTVTGITANGKPYDGNTTVTGFSGTATLSGKVGTDAVTLGGTPSGTFASKDAGTQAVTVTGYTISGGDAGNYNFSQPSGLSATITAKALTVTGITANGKPYDGNTIVTGFSGTATLSGKVGTEAVTLGGTPSGTFASKAAGTHAVTVTGYTISGADAGNYNFSQPSGLSATIATKDITGSFTTTNKSYDGNTIATVDSRTANGIISPDVVTLTGGTATFANSNAGTGKIVTLSGASLTGANAGNYNLTSVGTTTADITAKALVIGITATNKVYNGNADAATTASIASGLVDGDVVTVSSTNGAFNNKNVANGKAVTADVAISGTGKDNGNYSSNITASTTADITAKALVIGITATNKVYNGNADAATTASIASGLVDGDVVTVSSTNGAFNNKNVANGKAVTADVAISGTGKDNGNYSSNITASTTADITAKALVIGITATNKVYNGNADAATTASIASGLVDGDVVTVSSTNGAFNNKNVANGKAVTADVAISGTGKDNGNYSSNITASTTADITAKALVIGITATNKVYNGNADAATTASIASGLVDGDVVTVSSTNGAFNNKNVANGKAVTADVAISGTGKDNGNYSSNITASTTADITAKALVIGITATNKVYNGNADAATTASIASGLVDGDVVTVSSTNGAFNNKNVANGKAVTADVAISGTGKDNGNYSSNITASTTADITAKALVIGITATNKVYNGNADAATTASIASGLVDGDVVTVSSTNGAFNNKNVANGKAVTADVAISGTGKDNGNYSSNITASTTADITAKALVIGITATNKVYNGNADAATTASIASGLVDGDVVTVSSTNGAFNNKNVANGKAVTADVAISGTGKDNGNYSSNITASTTADITAKALVIGITATNKVYNGNADAATTASIASGLVDGDVVTVSSTNGAFNNKNVANGKAVTADVAISGTGKDNGNYSSNITASTTADITAKALVIGITATNKVYNGNADAATTASIASGLVDGDVVTVSSTNGAFNNKNVANGKAVTADVAISGTGKDNGNYSSNITASTTADITAKALVIGITATNKVYNGNADAATTASIASGLVDGDVVTVSSTNGAFNNKNVANGKAVTADVAISGTGKDNGNYSSNITASTTADITAKALVIGITATNKVYNGNADAATTASIASGLVDGDVVTVSSTNGAFNNKNVANGKAVTADVAISGTGKDNGNYSSNITASTTADITAKALVIGITATNKVYNGNADAATTASIASGLVDGDVVTVSSTNGAFNNKNVANGKAVTADVAISGTGKDNGNYSSNITASTTADITAKALVIGITATNKVYNGNADAATTASIASGLVDGDVVTVSSTNGAFNNKNVANGKAVTADVAISGTGKDNGNYSSNITASTTADITAKALVIGITATNKVYNGNADAATTASIASGLVDGDVVTVSSTNGAFNNKNVANGKAVTADVAISGTGKDNGNYSSNITASTTADITAKALVIGITATNKVYNGNADAATTASIASGLVDGDVVTVSSTNGAFNNKNVANGKAVTADVAISGTGKDNGNYSSNITASTTADITAKALVIGITATNKVYNGNADAATTASIASGLVDGDVVTVSSTNGAFNNKNVANGKAVTADVAISGTGKDNGNYSSNITASTTADITAKALVIGITATNKVYNGNADAATTASIASGLVDGDVVTVSSTNGAFNNKNVANGKAVTADVAISGTGKDNGNYSSNITASTTADITPKGLIGSFTAANKMYDGSTSATITGFSVATKVGTEDVNISAATASFNNAIAGKDKTVTLAGASLTGLEKGNYSLTSVNTTTATIFSAPIVSLVASDPHPINTPDTIKATFGGDVFNQVWNYTIAGTNITSQSTSQLIIKSSTPIVYSVTLTYQNGVGVSTTTPAVYAVFYDPSAGFVTGGGWITSPIYPALKYMQVSGKANFGFESKYEKGKTVPSGNTEFQFQEGGMNFKSTVYDFLVISGKKAQYKGTGTINGTGSYGFILTAIDGSLSSPKTADFFRIKIYDKTTNKTVYDNQYGTGVTADDADPTTTLGGGSIVIHDNKASKAIAPIVNAQTIEFEPLTLKAYPNPSTQYFTVKLQSRVNEKAQLKVFDVNGRPVYLTEGSSNQTYRFGDNFTSGSYFLKVTQGGKQQIVKLIKLK